MYESSAMRAYDKAKRTQAEWEALNYIEDGHWSQGDSYRQRCTIKKIRQLMLTGKDTILRKGHLCRMQVENLGFGVYQFSFQYKEATP